jgi:polyvinyl alcohol dehydrogenase (cytochrome)
LRLAEKQDSIAGCAILGIALVSFSPSLSAQDGASLYKDSCASCHDAGIERAPTRAAFRAMTPERVLAAMETGAMISMASFRTAAERRAIAEFVTGKAFGSALDTAIPTSAMCSGSDVPGTRNRALWNGWGQNPSNTRYQDAAGFSAAQVPHLKLKWAFGFPGDLTIEAQPSLAADRLFIGSHTGRVYSLNPSKGCVYWSFDAGAAVRTAVSTGAVGNTLAAFFGGGATAYSVDAVTGTLLWQTKVDDSPVARITGSPVFQGGRLYVPVASGEEGAAASPDYECCRFRGSVVALDAVTGKQIWKTYTIAEEARPTGKNRRGVQLWGPAGAPIWTSPAIDTTRNALYVTTGDNYSDPPTSTSDAFLAMDLDTGKLLWSRQMTASDAYNVACRIPNKTNCPGSNGPDVDFGSSPILVSLANGRRALIAGQKSGVVHALDPDRNGEILWQVRVGQGGSLGGVQWGSAADGTNVYVALSDIGRVLLPFGLGTDADPKRGGGMFALRLDNGERIWYTPPPGCGDRKRCSPAQSAAVSAMPGIAFSGSVDGHMRAYSAANGAIVWDVNTIRPYQTVNGVPARGGSLDGPGPVIGDGILYFVSGYTKWGGEPGNVLLAFSVDGK